MDPSNRAKRVQVLYCIASSTKYELFCCVVSDVLAPRVTVSAPSPPSHPDRPRFVRGRADICGSFKGRHRLSARGSLHQRNSRVLSGRESGQGERGSGEPEASWGENAREVSGDCYHVTRKITPPPPQSPKLMFFVNDEGAIVSF